MAFIPFSADNKNEECAITVDKSGRIYLNAALQRKLDCEKSEIELFIFFEEDTRRIGLAKSYPQGGVTKVKPHKFDADRKYAGAKTFLNYYDIEYQEGAVNYSYDGMVNGVMAFKASADYADQNKQKFKLEKNGNLESMG